MGIILMLSLILTPSTPEEFLVDLCNNSTGAAGAEYWADCASEEVFPTLAEPDSLIDLLRDKDQLTVDPGQRTSFSEENGVFRIEFGDSKWTWIDITGNAVSRKGSSVVLVINGEYYWSKLPVLETSSYRLDSRESLMSGIVLTFIVMVVAMVLILWARRRYV
jgi:hypothetical protein